MNFKEIQEIIKLANKYELAELKIEDGEFKLSIRSNSFQKNSGQVTTTTPQIVHMEHRPATVPAAPVTPASAPSDSSAEQKAAAAQELAESKLVSIKSPMVGTFYRSSSPDKPPFVKVGDVVQKGDVVCIIEAMKLFNEIECEVSGKIVKVIAEDASPVEYDQVLYLIEPS